MEQTKAQKTRKAAKALEAFGYWDFVTIQDALKMAEDYLRANHVECAVSTPERCAELRDMVDDLMQKALGVSLNH